MPYYVASIFTFSRELPIHCACAQGRPPLWRVVFFPCTLLISAGNIIISPLLREIKVRHCIEGVRESLGDVLIMSFTGYDTYMNWTFANVFGRV